MAGADGDEGDGSHDPAQRGGGRWSRLVPRTALGLAGLLFFMSIASAFPRAVLYASYSYRLGQTEDRVDAFAAGFGEAVDEAVDEIESSRDEAVSQVQAQLDELERFAASGETLSGLLEQAAPSVWFVSTLDEAGPPSVGSAFVVFSHTAPYFLLASFAPARPQPQHTTPSITPPQ